MEVPPRNENSPQFALPSLGTRSAAGPIAAKELLFSELKEVLKQRDNPFAPLWIITSSSALRREIVRDLPQRTGGALLGVVVHTLHSAAHAVLEALSIKPVENGATFPWVLRQAAAQGPTLRRELGSLQDGFGTAAQAMMEILDAGFHSEMMEAVEDALEPIAKRPQGSRALDLFRGLSTLRNPANTIRSEGDLLALARDAIRSGRFSPPSTFVVGFMDATSPGTDFLETLLAMTDTRVYFDCPPDPADPSRADSGFRFSAQFMGRLGHGATPPIPTAAPPTLHAFDASGREREALEIARRVRQLLDNQVSPEEIGVVGRTLEGSRVPLQRAFRALGIPFSMPAGSQPDRHQYRPFRGLLHFLRDGENTSLESWLESVRLANTEGTWHPETHADLRTGLRKMGIGTLSQWQDSLFSTEAISLPVRRGIALSPEDSVILRRRKLQKPLVDWASKRLGAIREILEEWPESASLREHIPWVTRLAEEGLGWTSSHPEWVFWSELSEELQGAIEPKITRWECAVSLDTLVKTSLPKMRSEERAGVRILDASRARSLTFEHLFLCQLNRGVFPRVVNEDPLLPESVRALLLPLLPDLPMRARGHDEERFLFAQLIASAPQVTLSWLRANADGAEEGKSVLVERLLLAFKNLQVTHIPREWLPLVEEIPAGSSPLRTPREHGIARALRHRENGLETWLGLALEEGASIPPEIAMKWAEFRLRVVREMAPNLATKEGRNRSQSTGPYQGWVGELSHPLDPRHQTLHVSTLENMAKCPWQTWLKRMLRIEATPETTRAPPDIPSNVVGLTVHHALELLVLEGHPELKGRDIRGLPPTISVGSPSVAALSRALQESALHVGRDNGLTSPASRKLLEEWSRPFVETCIALDWPQSNSVLHILGTEISGQFPISDIDGKESIVFFRADRAETIAEKPVLTDYKTGNPKDVGKTEANQRKKIEMFIREGTLLQGMGYAHMFVDSQGRYSYLKPNLDPRMQSLAMDRGETDLVDAFKDSTQILATAMQKGIFFPRVEMWNGKPGKACEYCDVSEACMRGDSGRRARFVVQGTRHTPLAPLPQSPSHETVFGHLYHLGNSYTVEDKP